VSRVPAHRRGVLVLALAATVVVAGLLVAGLQTIPVRTFALGVPDANPAALVSPTQRACEGPVRSSGPAGSVGIFGVPVSGSAVIAVVVFSTGGRRLAAGRLADSGSSIEHLVTLDHRIPGGRPVRVCIRAFDGSLSLRGTAAQTLGVRTSGVIPGTQFSLLLTRPGTFLGSLQTGFSRAAIFRPDWVGAWTFWALLGLLVATIGLAGVAVARASEDDGSRGGAP
jgi:hypothetical protein